MQESDRLIGRGGSVGSYSSLGPTNTTVNGERFSLYISLVCLFVKLVVVVTDSDFATTGVF